VRLLPRAYGRVGASTEARILHLRLQTPLHFHSTAGALHDRHHHSPATRTDRDRAAYLLVWNSFSATRSDVAEALDITEAEATKARR
jgi:hypothetical protein